MPVNGQTTQNCPKKQKMAKLRKMQENSQITKNREKKYENLAKLWSNLLYFNSDWELRQQIKF